MCDLNFTLTAPLPLICSIKSKKNLKKLMLWYFNLIKNGVYSVSFEAETE